MKMAIAEALDKVADILGKVDRIDRRVWYMVLLVLVGAPLIRPLGLPVSIEEPTRMAYNFLSNLPDGAAVVFSTAGSSAVPERGPAVVAVLKQLFSKNTKIIFVAFEADVPRVVDTIYLPKVAESAKYGSYFKQKVYGVDYLILPFATGGVQGMATLASDPFKLYAQRMDYREAGLVNDFPIMQSFKSAREWSVYIDVSGEPDFMNRLQIYQAPYGVPFIDLAQAMHWALHRPYLDAGQSKGMTNGLRGGAEYEMLIGEPTAMGLGGMDAFSLSYVVVWGLLIVGNVTFLAKKYGRKKA